MSVAAPHIQAPGRVVVDVAALCDARAAMSADDARWAALGLSPAKLGRPRVPATALVRPRLDALLDAAVAQPVTLLVAPAGAGKTAALAAWAARADAAVAWWTLDEDEAAGPRWLAYLLAALASARPELTPPHWPGPSAEPTAWLLDHVTIPLCRTGAPVVLVLDELERAPAPALWRAIAWLLEHRPPSLRMILCGRAPPPLPLARHEAAGAVARIDAAALQFDERETAAAGELLVGRPLDPAARSWLFARTAGWPTGVRLLADALAGGPPVALADATPLDRRALDFLAEEVLARQPAARRRFLLAAAIADDLRPDLCAALAGRADAGDELARLLDEGLFVAPIEGRAGELSLRFHPLFRAALLRSMSSEPGLDVADLHARAARWYAARGRLERAIHHCEAAGDPALAGELAAAHGFTLVRLRALGELARLVDAARRAPADPGREGLLATLAAWASMARGTDPARAAIAAARAVVGPSQLAASLDCLEAFLELRGGSPDVGLMRARAVLAELGPDSRGLVVALHLAAGLAAELLQRFPEALAHLEAAASAAAAQPPMPSLLPALAHRARILRRTGRLDDAAAQLDAADAAAAAHGWAGAPFTGEVALERATLLHTRAAFAEAEAAALDGLSRVRLGEDRGDVVRGATALARIRRDRGDLVGARDAAEEAFQAAAGLDPWLRALAELERDPLRAAAPPGDTPQARLVRTELRLARAEAALRERDLDPAPHLAALLDEQAEAAASGRVGDAITAGVLRAALLSARDPDAAASVLSDMPLQTFARQHRRPFVVHAAGLRPALGRLAPPARDALRELLGDPPPAGDDAPLSAREREVLRQLALGLTNQMIARRLFISLATVKTHVHNIFAKLAVDTRTAAVRRGRGLGLIADE